MLESENIEYKAKIPDNPDNLKGEIVSFLNSISGGKIYIGLDDDGKPVDFENEEIKLETFKEWEQRISNWITDAFEPQVRDLMNVSIENKATVIDIRSGNDKPYRYKSRKAGPFDNIYIRSGSTKRKASKDEITRMLKRKNADTFDRGKVAYENLSFHYAKNTFEKLERDFDEISLGFKRNDKDSYNYAALILSDDNPNIAKFAVYNGLDVLEFKDKKEFEGSVAKQIDQTLEAISIRNSKKAIINANGQREELLSYPEEAIREGVVNAFVHRDYTLSSDVKIEIYDDRLTITSPGSLPDGLTIEDIRKGANAKRNPILIKALDKMNYIENYGTGIRRILSKYKDFSMQPEFEATDNQFIITLYNKDYVVNYLELSDSQKNILKYLSDGKEASRQEIQDALGLKKSHTSEMLSKLKKENLITSVGSGKGVKYISK
ncbi:transcriptional regulator [Staphylococcus gallinarum]|nr:transcriptional regulator [Staphylococcus gallinarum]RIO78207.1 ArsR family transcriptional regulator [Staphylococcus gallinarum]